MKRAVGSLALVALVACSGGGEKRGAAPSSTAATTRPAPATTALPSSPTLGQWIGGGRAHLTGLATAAQGLRDLGQAGGTNQAGLAGLADAAQRAEDAYGSQPSPTNGQAEAEAFVASIGELKTQARAAAACLDGCDPVYSRLLAAQQSFNSAVERVVRAAGS